MVKSIKADLHFLLANSHCNWPHFESSSFHPLSLGKESFGDGLQLRLDVYCIIPQSFSKNHSPSPYLLIVNMLIADFTPHAGFASDYVDLIQSWVERIHVSPFDKISIANPVSISEAFIKI